MTAWFRGRVLAATSRPHFKQFMSNMKIHPRLLMATPTTAGTTKGFKPAPMALLPPIPLYRRLLRAHRKHLPREMRLLGDEYIKSEFRAHRDVENPAHIVRGSGKLAHMDDFNDLADWLFDRVADVRSETRRRILDRGTNGHWKDREDERFVSQKGFL